MKGVKTIIEVNKDISLFDFFNVYLEYRKEYSSVKPKTIYEEKYLFKKYVLAYDFLNIPISELKVKTFIDYFRLITKPRQLTRKKFNNLKSIFNNMLYLAIENDLRLDNPLVNIDYRKFAYKPKFSLVEPYTEQERNLIIKAIPNDNLYDLAIKLDFCLCIRIGELFALRFDDINNNLIKVCKFVNHQKQVEDDIKGHCNTGIRCLPLSQYALEVIAKIKAINPCSEYLFFTNGKFLDKGTFNRHLQKHCKALGIKYKSSHKIRFCTASILFNKGLNLTEIQYLLGHSNLAMTEHYLKNITTMSNFEKVCNILN